jgi:hypothetical protein
MSKKATTAIALLCAASADTRVMHHQMILETLRRGKFTLYVSLINFPA